MFQFLPDFNIPGLEKSLKQYLEFDIEKIVFSHSNNDDPVVPGSKDDLQFTLDYIQVRLLPKSSKTCANVFPQDIREGILEEMKKGTNMGQIPKTLQVRSFEIYRLLKMG